MLSQDSSVWQETDFQPDSTLKWEIGRPGPDDEDNTTILYQIVDFVM